MRLAIDLMGGDYAPQEILTGIVDAYNTHPQWDYILVGTQAALDGIRELPSSFDTVTCGSVMGMDEDLRSLVAKKDSSIWLATELVKKGEAHAVISAGSTAAQMAAATLLLGRIKGVDRPAIGGVIPTLAGGRLLLDIGANADCEPALLLQFARMGAVYARDVLGVENPRIGLLSNGTEAHKGNQLIREAHALIAASGLNFIGNLEGRDLLQGNYDVMVADGMSGNIAVKSSEGAIAALMSMLKREMTKSPLRQLGASLVKGGFDAIKRKMDYQQYGGAPLLGVNGVSVVCHGSSRALAIYNAAALAGKCVEGEFVEKLTAALGDESPATCIQS